MVGLVGRRAVNAKVGYMVAGRWAVAAGTGAAALSTVAFAPAGDGNVLLARVWTKWNRLHDCI